MVGSSQVTAGFECVAGAAGIGRVRPHGYEIGTACTGELEAVKISSGYPRADDLRPGLSIPGHTSVARIS